MSASYIGSSISLISKSDIRYKGTLAGIDPTEATVSLSGVKSLGTEGRRGGGDGEVGPSDQIFEFIVFRASDVKDLLIDPPTNTVKGVDREREREGVLRDPAVLDVSGVRSNELPPPGVAPIPQNAPFGNYGMYPPHHQIPPHLAPFPSYGPGFSPFNPSPASQFGATPPPGIFTSGQNVSPLPSVIGSSVNMPKPTQLNQLSGSRPNSVKPIGTASTPSLDQPILPPGMVASGRPGSTVTTSSIGASAPTQRPISRPSAKTPAQSSAVKPTQSQSPVAATTNASKVASSSARAANGGFKIQTSSASPVEPVVGRKELSAVEKLVREVGALHVSNPRSGYASNNATRNVPLLHQNRQQPRHPLPANPLVAHVGPAINGNGMRRGGATGVRRGSHAHGSGGGAVHSTVPVIDVPEQDFDFEEANKKFNKEEVAHPVPHESDVSEQKENGGTKEDDNEVVIPPPPVYYDKSKSFFDNISSEAKEREDVVKQGGAKAKFFDRKAERNKNLATFGVTGEQNGNGSGGYRGGYAYGRGGYRGRGRGRGGYRKTNNNNHYAEAV